jgi:L-Ala-D/L-Glu epimerase
MTTDRRTFLKRSALAGIACAFAPGAMLPGSTTTAGSSMKLHYAPYTLTLKHPFIVAGNSRTTTPVMLVEIEKDGITGYGEASLPPYLGETQETVGAFLTRVHLEKYPDPLVLEDILRDIDALAPGNCAAKAAVDIALHDWAGKKMGQPWCRMWGLDPLKAPVTTFTIGMDTPDVVRQKTREAAAYKVLKVKLGGENDREMIEAIRQVTDKPIRVDVNQGWKDRGTTMVMLDWLAGKGVEFVEQPMPKDRVDDLAWVRERSPLPLIGDEGVQRLADVPRAQGVYDGINIKLMKCTGMREARAMITLARAHGLKVMIGCMTETSCAISAAAQLSPLADYADLDGALLITNDPFDGARIVNGRVTLSDRPGIGVVKKRQKGPAR